MKYMYQAKKKSDHIFMLILSNLTLRYFISELLRQYYIFCIFVLFICKEHVYRDKMSHMNLSIEISAFAIGSIKYMFPCLPVHCFPELSSS